MPCGLRMVEEFNCSKSYSRIEQGKDVLEFLSSFKLSIYTKLDFE